MLKLFANALNRVDANEYVARVTTRADRPRPLRRDEVYLLNDLNCGAPIPADFAGVLAPEGIREAGTRLSSVALVIPSYLAHLRDGDILHVRPRDGRVWVMYRRKSRSNSMLVTERCNSNCIMCSQPPKQAHDDHLVDLYLRAIPLMDPDTAELGITGGEPTLLGDRLLRLISSCRNLLPNTALHLLSNGRMFNYLSFCRKLAQVDHPELMIGIPLYSDAPAQHDFVVQAKGAFDQTIRGILNLERFGIRVEVRIVLQQQTIGHLPRLAAFICRNLPFVDHVALMGLELMGHVRMNLKALWIDPADYQVQLVQAVTILAEHRLSVSIYNHQLCVLDRELWPYARKSISDWKNDYVETCDACAARPLCGGFFSSGLKQTSQHIRQILRGELDDVLLTF